MFRYRTLFARIWATFIALLLVAAILVNVIAISRLRKQALAETVLSLHDRCSMIQNAFTQYYETGETDEALFAYISQMAQTKSGSVQIADAYDKIVIELNYDAAYSGYADYARQNREVLVGNLHSGEIAYAIYEIGNMYYTPVVTVAAAICRGEATIGTIFVNGQVQGVADTVRHIQQATVAGVVIVLLLSGIVTFELSRRISKPLYQMNRAAKELAKGNFDQEIEVTDKGEIGQLTETFNAMAQDLKKYEDTRSSFVGNVSHELKSPLTAIQGFIQGMQDGTIPPQEHQTYLSIVLSETRRMNSLIVDLLDLVRIESDQFVLNKTDWDVNELIRRCIINFIDKIEEKHIDLAVDLPETRTMVTADADRIMQVVINLLDNAVKFCGEGGSVKLWTTVTSGKVQINISNSGKIIPEEDIKYIFDRFFKVDKSHNRKTPGTGIGLSIVKEIINRHDEQIRVSSQQGLGTVFTFTLPLAAHQEGKNTHKR
ncbi:MAG: HAMP domain-containing protein [Clostridia bacterium]|nr:HAMP domain-containing protein [Clostridia bacterium]